MINIELFKTTTVYEGAKVYMYKYMWVKCILSMYENKTVNLYAIEHTMYKENVYYCRRFELKFCVQDMTHFHMTK